MVDLHAAWIAVRDSVLMTEELVRTLFLDGFVAVIALAVVAPLLGTLLVLRRMPMLALAVPQLAGCGQALAYCIFAATLATFDPTHPQEPPEAWQFLFASAVVLAGVAVLTFLGRGGRDVGVASGIAFLLALGLREILFLESPYHEIFDDALHHGRILTVLEAGRDRVVICALVLLVVTLTLRRSLWIAAFDRDLARLSGGRPGACLLLSLVLVGVLSVVCVPVVGPEVVLALLLIPPAILRGAAPSLALFAPLSMLAGVLGALGSFVLAVSMDWSAGPSLVVSEVAASLLVAVLAWIFRPLLRLFG